MEESQETFSGTLEETTPTHPVLPFAVSDTRRDL